MCVCAGGSCKGFLDPVLDITHCHSCHIVLVMQASSDSVWRGPPIMEASYYRRRDGKMDMAVIQAMVAESFL